MQEIRPSNKPPRRPRWIRDADGRVRRESNGRSIGDIWAEQRRIRLAEAIEHDNRVAEKQAAKRVFLSRLHAKLTGLFRRAAPRNLARQFLRLVRRFTKKQLLFIIASGTGLVVLLAIGLNMSKHSGHLPSHKTVITKTGVLARGIENPGYTTVLPAGKSIEQLGGWGRVSPPDKNPVFAYTDQIAGVRITVSEQPLPDSFKNDPQSSTADLAKQFGANDVITTEKITFYIGTSSKGPQSVIASKGSVLILIKSDAKITNQDWSVYVESLQ